MVHRTRRQVLAVAGTIAATGCISGRQIQPADQHRENSEQSTDPSTDSPYTDAYDSTIESIVLVGTDTRGGSGFVYNGYIVTNHHVVEELQEIDVRFHQGDWNSATLVASDVYADLAVLETDIPNYATNLEFVDIIPPIGTEVLALGSPFGLEASVTQGIISGRNRSLPSPTGFSIPNTVQTDAGLEPGNSGGPLVTLDGEVTGVVVAGAGASVGFAVSPLFAQRVIPELIQTGTFEHAFLGIRLYPVTPTLAEANNLPEIRGVYIVELIEDGPPEQPFQASDQEEIIDGERVFVGGDVLVELGGHSIDTNEDLGTVLALELSPGDETEAVVVRDGEYTTLTVNIGTRPAP